MFPAHAGMNRSNMRRWELRHDVPRIRGDKLDMTNEYQSEQDAWQAMLVRAVGIAIANYVDQAGLQRRRLDELTVQQYEAMGVAACAEYIRQRRARRESLDSSPQPTLPEDRWEL
jgi:hypothetical protein